QLSAEDHRRHAGDAHFAGDLVFALHHGDVGIAFQQFSDLESIHPAKVGDVGKDADIADILAILEIGDEDPLHHTVLHAGGFRPADQAVGVHGVGAPGDGLEIKGDAFLFALGDN